MDREDSIQIQRKVLVYVKWLEDEEKSPWLEFKLIFCGFSIPVMCFWNWKIILILGPATPLNFMCGLGGGSQNSSQTSSSEVWFDDQVWNGISSSWRRNPLDTSEVIGTHCVLPPYANCRSDDCLANDICQWLFLKDSLWGLHWPA